MTTPLSTYLTPLVQRVERRWPVPAGGGGGHRPVTGDDFMHPHWCGGCEHCRPQDAGVVCVECSYDPATGMPSTPVAWPCRAASRASDRRTVRAVADLRRARFL